MGKKAIQPVFAFRQQTQNKWLEKEQRQRCPLSYIIQHYQKNKIPGQK